LATLNFIIIALSQFSCTFHPHIEIKNSVLKQHQLHPRRPVMKFGQILLFD